MKLAFYTHLRSLFSASEVSEKINKRIVYNCVSFITEVYGYYYFCALSN